MSSGQFPGWPDDPVKNPEVKGDPSTQINPDALGPAPSVAPETVPVSLPPISAAVEPAKPVVLADDADELRRMLQSRQNPLLGILGGLAGAIVGGAAVGALCAAIVTHMGAIPILVVGVGTGYLTGRGIRLLGKSVSPAYGVAGMALALLGTAWGSLFWLAVNWAMNGDAEAFGKVFSEPMKYLNAGVGWMGYLNYPAAAIVGFLTSFQRLDRAVLYHLASQQRPYGDWK